MEPLITTKITITDEIKFLLFDALFDKLKEELECDNDEDNIIMEQMIINNSYIFVSYNLLHYVVYFIEIEENKKQELFDYTWTHKSEFIKDFQNYILYFSVPHLK